MVLQAFLDDVRRTVLPNGLTLVSREHRRGGVVAINTWVKAGYFHEPDDVAGMAHLFEHMFFKGSKNFPGAEEIAQHVSQLGGSTNAGTIYDSTNYYFVLPREGFAKGVQIQADAILNPLFDPEELRKESEVVIEESNRKLDNPPAVATELMFATAFTRHRMKRWRIGSNEVLRNIRRENLLAFFETLYRPSNIIVVVAGDVTHEEALSVVGESFGRLPAGELRKEGGPVEPVQSEFRFDQSTGDISQSYSVFGWHTPGEHHPDEEALDLLSIILGSGRYSRFYREAVGPGKANSVNASNSVFEDVGIFTVRASYEDANLDTVEAKIASEIERMKKYGPTEFEVELARNRIEAGFIFELEDVLGQAQTLAFFESRGSYADMEQHLQRLRGVSASEIRDVANRYLTFPNLTLYRYQPHGSGKPDRVEVLRSLEEAVLSGPGEPPAPIAAPERSIEFPPALGDGSISRFVLSSGIPLYVREESGTPTVSVSISFRGGRVHERDSNAGITQLMARSMRRGTVSRSAEEIDREIEYFGTQLGMVVQEDFLSFSVDVLRRSFEEGVALLADVVLNPVFPEDGIEEERHLQVASIRRALDSSGERPFQLFASAFYGTHPYALPESGFEASVASLDQAMLRRWYEEQIVADGALIVVAGDAQADAVHQLCEDLFGALPKSRQLHPATVAVQPPAGKTEVVEERQRKQTAMVIGYPIVPPQHQDWTVLRLIQDVTSGLAGTFFAELRGKRSLAYTVYAGTASHDLGGAFVGYIASEASKEREAREALLGELKRLGEDGISREDLDRAKSHLAGVMKIRLQTNSALASEIAQNYLLGLGIDFSERFLERIRGVTLEEARDVAKKYLSGENYTVAILRGKG